MSRTRRYMRYSGIVATSAKEKITVAVFFTPAQGSDIESASAITAISQALLPSRPCHEGASSSRW
jgi:hypothetical protein